MTSVLKRFEDLNFNWRPLRELLRASNRQILVAVHKTRRQAQIIGFGPTGKVVGWWTGSEELRQWDADSEEWLYVTTTKA